MNGAAEQPVPAVPLTVAIPAYNRARSVLSLLESILSQTINGDEVIVSDDGSSDGTAERASDIPGVRVIRHEKNQGMVGNWNACLKAATHDWICILHDDDKLGHNALATLRRACALANEPALVLHRYSGDPNGDAFVYKFFAPCPDTVLNCPTIPSGAVVHRQIIEEVGLFNPYFKYSADLEYFPRIVARFPLIVIENPRIVGYRLHRSNYQYEAWRQTDFCDHFEELQLSVIAHAGIQDEKQKRDLLDHRMLCNLLYMLENADRLRDPTLVRRIAGYCQRYRHGLSMRQMLATKVAVITGRTLRRHSAAPFEPLQS